MSPSIGPVAPGYRSITLYLVVEGAAAVLDFLRDAFGAEELRRMLLPDGRVAHAEVRIGDSVLMLADSCSEFPPTQAGIHLYMAEVDAVYERVLRLGATAIRPPADQFYGDRSASVRDRWGNSWHIATHIEDLSEEEMSRRAAALHG